MSYVVNLMPYNEYPKDSKKKEKKKPFANDLLFLTFQCRSCLCKHRIENTIARIVSVLPTRVLKNKFTKQSPFVSISAKRWELKVRKPLPSHLTVQGGGAGQRMMGIQEHRYKQSETNKTNT